MFSQEALPNLASDHIPILFSVDSISYGPCPFRFELMWLEVLGFREELKGSTSFVFGQKLKLLKERILRWKREEFGGTKTRKHSCL